MSVADVVGRARLLEEDPELGAALDEELLEQARRLLIVPVVRIGPGPWDAAALAHEPSLGLLVLDGLLTVNVALRDRVGSDLAGPGDVLHAASVPEAFVPASITYHANERTRVAVLDRAFIAAARRWPALLLALHDRLRVQERRHVVANAITKLPRVEDRVLAVLWHLAERWGRVTSGGVLVPLSLTHETIGRLAGAARPTISLGLAELERDGAVRRREDGGFLLAEASRATLAAVHPAATRSRPLAAARTAAAGSLADAGTSRRPALMDIASVRRRIAALHEEMPERTRDVEERLAASRARAEDSVRLRAQIADERAARRGS